MMKRIAYLSAVATLLLFTGCSKEPAIDATAGSNVSGNASNSATTATTNTDANANVSSTSSATQATSGNAVIEPITNTTSSSDQTVSGDASGAVQIVSINFDFDKYDIREDMQANIKSNAGLVKEKSFKLEGNCDEFGSDEYNFALGLKRANAVKSALVNEGVKGDSISMVSLGEGNPLCVEKTKECWAKNRRVDFKLP